MDMNEIVNKIEERYRNPIQNKGKKNRRKPKKPNFNINAAKIKEIEVLASE